MALVLEIIQGKARQGKARQGKAWAAAEASRKFDLTPAEIEGGVGDGKRGMENALRAKAEDEREQCERQLKDLQEGCGEADTGDPSAKKLASLLGNNES
ncbi:transposase [uncultured Stenotrophomonas sp.]|uniref:transposase n=1 Tax=uncultured Stenotrophomonas sp. TaxID=165438 RepID=UPI0025EF14BA|nr:transposase [uncultured Stenotrophomonas sp.]